MNERTLPMLERLESLGDELRKATIRLAAARRRRIRRLKIAGLATASFMVVAAGGVAAERLFGDPAPANVKRNIAAVDDGLPEEIRLNPNVEEARSVAVSDKAVLYFAELDDGGSCTQMVINGREHAAQCVTAAQAAYLPIAVTIPSPDPGIVVGPLSIGGRVNVRHAQHIEVLFGDGSRRSVPLGDNGFFVFDLSEAAVAKAHRGLSLTALDGSGTRVAFADLSEVLAEKAPETSPVEFLYRSSESDLSLVNGVDGTVNDPRVAWIEIEYPDGSITRVTIEAGEFHFRLPEARRNDFARAAGRLIARATNGSIIMEQPFASVAFWRGAERSGAFEQQADEEQGS